MTATDELRRLLDERGVEWTYGDGTVSYASDGRWFHAWAYNDDMMCVSMGYLTPAQAVEATLVRGTCKLVPTRDKPRSKAPTLTCSECGWWTDEIGKAWNYCPSCGRRVIG